MLNAMIQKLESKRNHNCKLPTVNCKLFTV